MTPRDPHSTPLSACRGHFYACILFRIKISSAINFIVEGRKRVHFVFVFVFVQIRKWEAN